jgi:hypothetical protein
MPTSQIPLVAMPSRSGLDSAAPPTYLSKDGLSIADNIYYSFTGERRKRLGTALAHATSTMHLSSTSANVKSMEDFWRHGASLTPTQRFVYTASTGIFAWAGTTAAPATISSTWGTNASITDNIVIAQGYSVFSNGVDNPMKWDQTTLSQLSTAAPLYTSAAYHLRRLFVVGTAATPSRVDISAGGDITTWTGGDTGNFVIDEDDGDRIVGVSETFHKRLYIFKGPNLGSIHEIAGNTLASLTRDKIYIGHPALNQHGIITTQNDIFWISKFGAHSLRTTQKYGDTEAYFISSPIQDLFRDEKLNASRLDQAYGFWHPLYGIIGWVVAPATATTNTWAIIYHYLISDPGPQGKKFWSIWKFNGMAPYSVMQAVTPAGQTQQPGRPRIYFGGSADGQVYKGDQSTLTDAQGSAYTAKVRTGIILDFEQAGAWTQEKQFYSITTFFEPVGGYTHDLNIIVDNRVTSTTLSMAGLGDRLG